MEASPLDNAGQHKASTSLRLVSPLKPLCPSTTSPKSPFTNWSLIWLLQPTCIWKKKMAMHYRGMWRSKAEMEEWEQDEDVGAADPPFSFCVLSIAAWCWTGETKPLVWLVTRFPPMNVVAGSRGSPRRTCDEQKRNEYFGFPPSVIIPSKLIIHN